MTIHFCLPMASQNTYVHKIIYSISFTNIKKIEKKGKTKLTTIRYRTVIYK